MDASSLAFFQAQVADLEQELKQAQEQLINELENRTNIVGPATTTSPAAVHSYEAWESKIASWEDNIEDLAQRLAEARSTCAFIIQRERDKIHLLSSTEDALVSCMCLIVLDSGRDLPRFVLDFHQWNENRGLTGVLHVFSSWCAAYVEGQKSVVSLCLSWLREKCSVVNILYKNGFPVGTPEADVPMKERKVPNCTLNVEWHSNEMRAHDVSSQKFLKKMKQEQEQEQEQQQQQKKKQLNSSTGDSSSTMPMMMAGDNSSCTDDATADRDDNNNATDMGSSSASHAADVVQSMIDALGRAAMECVNFAPVPTYLLSQMRDIRHDGLNPSRLLSTETLTWQPFQGRFIFAVGSRSPVDSAGAAAANATMRQRLQRAPGSSVVTPWGGGPIACMAVVVNHPVRNILEEATALPEALADALRAADAASGGPFVVAVSWSAATGSSNNSNNNACDSQQQEHNNPEFEVCNSARASVIGWGVRKLRCMIQFAMENDEKTVLSSELVDRLTVVERQKIRLVSRVRFHRCMEASDIYAPPSDGVLSTTSKSIDEQLRHVSHVTRSLVGRRQAAATSAANRKLMKEHRGLRSVPGLDLVAQEREAMRKENEERNQITDVFHAMPSFDEKSTILVSEAVQYWMTADAEGLDSVLYPKLRRLMQVLEVPHTDAKARVELDRFYVITNRLRHA